MNNLVIPHNVSLVVDANALPVATGWITTLAPQAPAPPAPKKTRRWTGNPRGKTKEIQDKNIRKRRSYLHFVDIAQKFRSYGISADHLHHILKFAHDQRVAYKGYFYRANGWWAQQSLQVLIEDLKNYEKREELGLN